MQFAQDFKYRNSQYANMGRWQMRVSVSISVTFNTLPLQPRQTFERFISQTVAWIVGGSEYTWEKRRAIPNALEDSFEIPEDFRRSDIHERPSYLSISWSLSALLSSYRRFL